MKTAYNKNDLGKSFGLTVAMMLVLQLVLSLAFSRTYNEDIGQYVDWAYWTIQSLYAVALGSVTFIYARLTKTNVASATKARVKPPLAHIGWGCLATAFLILFMLPANEWFLYLFELVGLKRPQTSIPTNLPQTTRILLMVAVACVIPCITEEFLFRGTISSSLLCNKNKLASLSICGGLFALFHLSAAQTLHQFVLGTFLALLYFRSGSIWTTVCVHFFNNAVVAILDCTLSDSIFVGKYDWVFAIVGAIGFAGCVVGYLFTTKSKWNTNAAEQQAETDNNLSEEQEKINPMSFIMLVVACAVCLFLWIWGLFQ